MWCNAKMNYDDLRAKEVSVFSDESRVVQPERIRTLAQAGVPFQYSLTNLVWCNGCFFAAFIARDMFQYSLTNLVWCNGEKRPKNNS